MPARRTTIAPSATSVTYGAYLPFGASDVLRVGVMRTSGTVTNGAGTVAPGTYGELAMSFTLTCMHDSGGVGHSITDVIGDDVGYTVDVVLVQPSLSANFINIVVQNLEPTDCLVQVKSMLQDPPPCVSL